MLFIIWYFFLTIYCNDKKFNEIKNNSLRNKLKYLNQVNITKSTKINSNEKYKRNLQSFENIRIELHMECLEIFLSIEEESFSNLIRESIIYAKDTIEKLIKVQRLTNKINLNNLQISKNNLKTCPPFTMDTDIDADLAIFLSYTVPTPYC